MLPSGNSHVLQKSCDIARPIKITSSIFNKPTRRKKNFINVRTLKWITNIQIIKTKQIDIAWGTHQNTFLTKMFMCKKSSISTEKYSVVRVRIVVMIRCVVKNLRLEEQTKKGRKIKWHNTDNGYGPEPTYISNTRCWTKLFCFAFLLFIKHFVWEFFPFFLFLFLFYFTTLHIYVKWAVDTSTQHFFSVLPTHK